MEKVIIMENYSCSGPVNLYIIMTVLFVTAIIRLYDTESSRLPDELIKKTHCRSARGTLINTTQRPRGQMPAMGVGGMLYMISILKQTNLPLICLFSFIEK